MRATDLVNPDLRNAAAAKTFDFLTKAVMEENGEGLVPAPSFDAYQAASTALLNSGVALASVAPVGTVIHTPDGPLTVASVVDASWTRDVTLTADGVGRLPGWHSGATTGEPVRYEQWAILSEPNTGYALRLDSRSHGYLDAGTRRTIQTG